MFSTSKCCVSGRRSRT